MKKKVSRDGNENRRVADTLDHENIIFMLGEIHERAKCIPDIRDDIASLKRTVAIIEVKGGAWGIIGGFLSGLYLQLKHWVNIT